MAVHYLSVRMNASGLDDLSVIRDAISWFVGHDSNIEEEKTTSYYGSPVYIFSTKINKNKLIYETLNKFETQEIQKMISMLESRLDEENSFHFRISHNQLIDGEVKIAEPDSRTVKCKIKFELYPGQDIHKKATEFFNKFC